MINILEDGHIEGSTGRNLYNKIMDVLRFHEIPLGNFVGFAVDGAANIMGENNSLCSRLKEDLPGITIFKCICHSFHLCASEAAKTLPKCCEELPRNLYSYFSHSSKRKHQFKQFQDFLEIKPHKLLHPSQTRWLSLHQSVRRVLEQWEALKAFFKSKEDERLLMSEQINMHLADPSIYLYLIFLDFILAKENNLNLLFQSNSPTLHTVHEKVSQLYKTILGYFCSGDLVNRGKFEEIDPQLPSFHAPLNRLYLGDRISAELKDPKYKHLQHMIQDIQIRCRHFMITLCQQIKKRFDFNNEFLHRASYLSPVNLTNVYSRMKMPSLHSLATDVPRIYTGDIQDLDDEWRKLDVVSLPDFDDNNIQSFYM